MPSHRLASLGNPGSKDTSCFFGFDGVEFLLKKERVFFFQGPALQAFGQCGGASMRTRFCENYFLGIWIFAKPRLICFLHFVRAEEGSGEESARASLSDFFGGGLKLLQRFYKTVGECLSCFHWFSE